MSLSSNNTLQYPLGVDLPFITDNLLNALDTKFPEACPNPKDDDRTIWRKVGQREVVRYLQDQHRRQREAGPSVGIL